MSGISMARRRLRTLSYALNLAGFIGSYRALSLVAKPRSGRVLFASDSADAPKGNMKCVYDYMVEYPRKNARLALSMKKNLWSLRSPAATLRLAWRAATSSVIVLDDYFPEASSVHLSPQTFVLQLWHASGAFKRVGHARPSSSTGSKKSRAHRGYSAAIVSAEPIRASYAQAFAMDVNKVHATGIPRTDIFFDQDWIEHARVSLRSSLNIAPTQKLVLVAMTFHGDSLLNAYSRVNDYDWNAIAEVLPQHVFVIKNHPFAAAHQANWDAHPRVIEVDPSADIDTLLAASDVVVTDFSSIIFEAAMLHKPVIHAIPAESDYSETRGLFFPAESYLFGPVAGTTEELIAAVENPTCDQDRFDALVARHIAASDGASTQRVVEELIEPAMGMDAS